MAARHKVKRLRMGSWEGDPRQHLLWHHELQQLQQQQQLQQLQQLRQLHRATTMRGSAIHRDGGGNHLDSRQGVMTGAGGPSLVNRPDGGRALDTWLAQGERSSLESFKIRCCTVFVVQCLLYIHCYYFEVGTGNLKIQNARLYQVHIPERGACRATLWRMSPSRQ